MASEVAKDIRQGKDDEEKFVTREKVGQETLV